MNCRDIAEKSAKMSYALICAAHGIRHKTIRISRLQQGKHTQNLHLGFVNIYEREGGVRRCSLCIEKMAGTYKDTVFSE